MTKIISLKSNCTKRQVNSGIIEVREINKRYPDKNLNQNLCVFESCSNEVTHWLTRQNSEVCQSDLVCSEHAKIWQEVKRLISNYDLN